MRGSLFETQAESGIGTSIDWVEALVLGEIATALAIVAVAIAGFMMLTGRVRMAGSFRVILGCFVLFGASTIAAALMDSAGELRQPVQVAFDRAKTQPREELPPSEDSPYSRASVNRGE
ncbi:TrbC/VirB2 family protein [Erythrobacter aurantius]|uniref:TrbC/VirB2 family protein n=1 Tax=Erythrobacter aurantius TaxID=2909249 RepID=UPI002079DFC6|nr:TrbC/VirB2 family protein [Erythrobacter aurantius]